ncbi:MAG TPA: PilZ domain-containing protein [Nitrospiria bacterium]|nr:PilZ domain-containing protein [Nitrospiria bacterium]
MDNSLLNNTHNAKISQRRQHLRLTAMGVVTLTVQGEEPQEAYLASIGRGGFGVYLHRPVKVKQLVVMTLKLIEGDQDGQELKVAARIRWAKSAGQLYMVGLQFEPMSDQRYSQLLRHLNVMEELQLP